MQPTFRLWSPLKLKAFNLDEFANVRVAGRHWEQNRTEQDTHNFVKKQQGALLYKAIVCHRQLIDVIHSEATGLPELLEPQSLFSGPKWSPNDDWNIRLGRIAEAVSPGSPRKQSLQATCWPGQGSMGARSIKPYKPCDYCQALNRSIRSLIWIFLRACFASVECETFCRDHDQIIEIQDRHDLAPVAPKKFLYTLW